MKIDFIIGSLRGGGAERVVSSLANYFDENGHSVRVITFKGEDKYELNNGIIRKKFHADLPFFNYAIIRAIYHLFRFYWFKRNRPDIISSHINRMALATIPIAKLYNIKVVSSEHSNHSTVQVDWSKKFVWNCLYKYADGITILTKYDFNFFKRKNNNVVVIHNPNSFNKPTEKNITRDKVILAIGNLDSYFIKGFDNLIDIASKIKLKYPDWKFEIIGEGINGRAFLENKINELELYKTVSLKGFRDDVDILLRKSSIFILTSRFEGMPMALIEAMSQGTTCISYDCISGPSDIIEDNSDGVLVQNQNHEEMVEKLDFLIANEQFRNDLGCKAIIKSENFSLDIIGNQWTTLFKNILNN